MPPKYFNTYKALNVTTGKLGCYTLLGTVGGLLSWLSDGRGGNMSGWEKQQYGRLGEPASGKLFQQTRDIEPILVQYWADGVDGGPTLVQCLVFSWNFLPCKAKRQYLITSQVSRYCLLPLQSSYVGGWIDEMPSMGCIQPTEYRWPINIPTKGPVHT